MLRIKNSIAKSNKRMKLPHIFIVCIAAKVAKKIRNNGHGYGNGYGYGLHIFNSVNIQYDFGKCISF